MSSLLLQNKMNLDGLFESVVQVQITDLDNSGYSDLLITGDGKSLWLHTQLLKNRISLMLIMNLLMECLPLTMAVSISMRSHHFL